MTNDGFQPDRPPVFLSEPAEETGQPDLAKADIEADIGRAWDVALISSRILKASILAATVTAIGIAVVSIENPVSLVASVLDWGSDKPALQPDADPPAPTVQSIAIAGMQGLPTTTTTDTPTRQEIAAAAEPARQSQPAEPSQPVEQAQPVQPSQAEIAEPVTEAMFKQFQAWAAEQEAQAGPAQAAPVRVAQDAPVRSVKKHRRVRSVQNARAEVRLQRNQRARVREEQDPRGQVPPGADPRLQNPSTPNPQTPSLLQSLGIGN